MISANQLPDRRSVYEAPPLIPGQELTEAQQEQAKTAQIAGIILSVATTKAALHAAVTNQIVMLLHSADLFSEAGIKAFAYSAASVVRLASRQAQEITWTGVKMRAEVMGVDFVMPLPDPEDLPADERQGRKSSLERAYARLAEEYKKNLDRTKDDPVIKELVSQLEEEGISPLPRPDTISNDAVERIADGEETWTEAFAKASEEEGTSDPEGPSDEEIARDSLAERLRQQREAREAEFQELISATRAAQAERSREDGDSGSESESRTSTAYASNPRQIVLTEREVEVVIEQYAEHKAGERAERMVSQDIAGSSRNIYRRALDSMPKNKIKGYRRVIHPELSQSGTSCGLCIVASTMVYTKADLLPIHSGCNCETCEIYSVDGRDYDPGHIINMEDLEVFYREAGDSTRGWDLKKGRYKVVDHPEYGPTLVNAHPNKQGKIKKEYIPTNADFREATS